MLSAPPARGGLRVSSLGCSSARGLTVRNRVSPGDQRCPFPRAGAEADVLDAMLSATAPPARGG
ncbi:hypothetical protein [Streptomyces acidiscabies]|uniref:hypothetical protein n=1 Tax=Streptomyces acidiscabies TaxID=42234 RepID=UPI00117CBCEC|nr:hypothetical protein [Streptomyces acidiscabies]